MSLLVFYRGISVLSFRFGLSFFIYFLLVSTSSLAGVVDTGYFGPPIAGQLIIAGGFGELRPNHFHTGMDFTTKGEENIPILAAADGYVSRISIKGRGYGRALYVDHPNGYTTVYAHLNSFSPELAQFIKSQQYQEKCFEVELFPEPYQFSFRKGDTIAYSGNTGSSVGPHLHFEIRETITERPVNPLLYYQADDAVPPTLTTMKMYPSYLSSVKVTYSNGQQKTFTHNDELVFRLIKQGGVYVPSYIKFIEVDGSVAFGIGGFDRVSNSTYTIGIYQLELCINGEPRHQATFDKLDFRYNRFINAHIDYAEKRKKGRYIQRLHTLALDSLPIYNDSLLHTSLVQIFGESADLHIYAKDVAGNSSIVSFKLLSAGEPRKTIQPVEDINPSQTFHFKNDSFFIDIEEGTVYQSTNFEWSSRLSSSPRAKSPLFFILDNEIPAQRGFTVGISAAFDTTIQEEKVGIMSSGSGFLAAEKNGNYYITKAKVFGYFYLAEDEAPPTLRALNIYNGKNMKNLKGIYFKADDAVSGLEHYDLYIDGEWQLLQYEPKRNLLYYEFDGYLAEGKHELEVLVKDGVGNANSLKYTFVY